MKKILVRFCSFVLIIGGLFLLFNKPLRNYFIKNTGENYAIAHLSKQELENNKRRKSSFDFNKVQSLNSEAILKSQINGKKNNLPVIAGIAIPSVNIRLPIFKGLSNESLLYGAGTLAPDQEMGIGNYALASHRSDQPNLLFTPLENINMGDKIFLTDLTNVYTYQVNSKERIEPSRVEVLEEVPDKELVTLITCGDLYAETRLVVQGELIQTTSIRKITKEMSEAFDLPIQSY
ncbi:class A sortase [Enterococcus pallens]|uniref:Sortase n=1 Tax=Enterococcus pallens ATCC BAA-351 TaxID=1158607 RepID=R2SVG7_9ENTE|nr:class A sortase [Enterococcus pallens]EOH92039.1 sortase [Enterococcus pallens ATCC BAA-351]EOU25066.1 hypothetical protein I588_01054 [Enterococcus pallens ATCC BAA-351]OJG72804.1 sortase [Enterococcus pallens]